MIDCILFVAPILTAVLVLGAIFLSKEKTQ